MKLGEQNVSDLYIGLVKERTTWSSEKEMLFWYLYANIAAYSYFAWCCDVVWWYCAYSKLKQLHALTRM
jgi:hypothetical protein